MKGWPEGRRYDLACAIGDVRAGFSRARLIHRN